MHKVLMAGVAAISLTIMPAAAIAQSEVPDSANSVDDSQPADMTAEQQGMYDGWPSDRQTEFDSWTPEQQAYFWGLSAANQEGYWALTPDQRTQIQQMTPEQQQKAWASIAAQLSGAPATPSGTEPTPATPPDTTTPPATPPDTTQPPVGAAPPMSGMEEGDSTVASPGTAAATSESTMPASEPSSGNTKFVSNATVQGGMTTPTSKTDYPVCKGAVQDSCINPGAR